MHLVIRALLGVKWFLFRAGPSVIGLVFFCTVSPIAFKRFDKTFRWKNCHERQRVLNLNVCTLSPPTNASNTGPLTFQVHIRDRPNRHITEYRLLRRRNDSLSMSPFGFRVADARTLRRRIPERETFP